MKKRHRDRYPVFETLGDRHDFLGNDAAVAASRDERIRSVWPFLVRKARAFHKSLKPRERVNFDPEDIALELWAALAAKDHKWEPEKGKYITFAGVVIDRELSEIRDRARTVESPRNSSCRMKEYLEEEAQGTISQGRLKTANDIRRTSSGTESIGGVGEHINHRGPDPALLAAQGEEDRRRDEAIKLAVRKLTPYESAVLGLLSGLWGKPRHSAFWVAWMTRRETGEVRKTYLSATRKVREFLTSIDHPVTQIES